MNIIGRAWQKKQEIIQADKTKENTLTNSNEIKKYVSAKQNAKIDLTYLEKNYFLLPTDTKSSMAKEYRSLKRKILLNCFDLNNLDNILLVTSAKRNEGKTFNSINLAISASLERDRGVILIDANVKHPSVHNVFGLNKDYLGLNDYISSNANTISDILIQTDIAHLSLITTGHQEKYDCELLASEKMKSFIKEMRMLFPTSLIIIDAPNVLETPETLGLMSNISQVAFVVSQNKTTQKEIEESIDLIPDRTKFAFIMNNVKKMF